MKQPVVDLAAFRAEVRAFVAAELPAEVREKVRLGAEISKADQSAWQAKLRARGWMVPAWPIEWGGTGWSPAQRSVFQDELVYGHAPEGGGITFDMVGPILIRHGSDWQQQHFLPRIVNGEHWWCQGYSEPNAGSDLASLSTRADKVRKDDGSEVYKVNGSKIWTSGAHHANWIFTLVRTDSQAKTRQAGISVLLIDMSSPGISLRPIIGIHGWRLFNQVFLDDVEVPVVNRVGAENEGWTIAKGLLEHERLTLARVAENRRRLAKVRRIGMELQEAGEPLMRRPWFARRFRELEVRLETLAALVLSFRARAEAGKKLGPETGMLKLIGSQLIQEIENLSVDALGPDTLTYDRDAHFGASASPQSPVADRPSRVHEYAATASARRFVTRGFTIAGGSSEVQHELLAKQVLGL